MDEFNKFLRKADAKLKAQLRKAMHAIMEDKLCGFDIAPLVGQQNMFRCRIRNVRIIFMRTVHGNVLCSIGFRGNVYKMLKR